MKYIEVESIGGKYPEKIRQVYELIIKFKSNFNYISIASFELYRKFLPYDVFVFEFSFEDSGLNSFETLPL